jgi:Peptidase family M48
MYRLAFHFLTFIPLLASSCFGEETKTKLVPSEPFGGSPPANTTVNRTSIRPAPAEAAARVDLLGRKILAANPQIGMKPQFMVIGSPQGEIFHKKNEAVFITDGLVKQCRSEGELAAVLCHELGKMVSEREIQSAPGVWRQRRLPPPDVRIGNEGPGETGADRTRLAELATFEQDRRRDTAAPPLPPDPNLLARTYLQKAGFLEADLKAAQPLLQAAAANMTFEKQMTKPPVSNWGN